MQRFNHSNFKRQMYLDYDGMSEAAASFLYEAAQANPDLLICAASGSSPRKAYTLFTEKMQAVSARHRVKVLTLDEWVGIPQESPSSSGYQIQQQLIEPLGSSTHFMFDGTFHDETIEIAHADAFLHKNGPIDVCILGVGTNGHLGLNEPDQHLQLPIHTIQIADSTRQHIMVADLQERPEYGITLGIGDIMRSKKILFLVNGPHKRAVMERFFEGHISSQLPVSLLWLHPDVTCICDAAACEGLG